MLLYRITKAAYADKLVASGIENRWNSNGRFVIYAASSAALACLENVVHTSGMLLYTQQYRLVIIEMPDQTERTIIEADLLPGNWKDLAQQSFTRKKGNEWYDARSSLLLQIPSAVIPSENNFVINTAHEDFMRVKILRTEPFLFDARLKIK